MKKSIIFCSLLLTLFTSCNTDVIKEEQSANNEMDLHSRSSYNYGADKGVIRIKLSKEIGDNININTSGKQLMSNISPLNTFLGNIKATQMKRLFPYAGKYEKRTRKEGLHLWYVVKFDKKISIGKALTEAKKISGVEFVEKQFSPKMLDYTITEANDIDKSQANKKLPTNDPRLEEQWHYNNTGRISGSKVGADINLFKAWEVEKGKRNVVVCVVDGGVDYKHEDLKDNMYVNEAEKNGVAGVDDDNNGYVDDIYGFNFVDYKGEIIPQSHGTHVAGTVSARNNNGIGVAGVAGGDGTANSGVRIMNTQIFRGEAGGDAPSAIKYGADNGAVISQNSWGYPEDTGVRTISQSEKEAIDYFIKYAGCDNEGNQLPNSPMKGGIVIFAAGNDDSEFTSVPAYYKPVVAVTSMAPNFKKAYYSTYGEWADIMAPGGDDRFYR